MLPNNEIYQNGNIQLHLINIDGIMKYWVKGGVGCIEFGEKDFDDLLELLAAAKKEVKKRKKNNAKKSKRNTSNN